MKRSAIQLVNYQFQTLRCDWNNGKSADEDKSHHLLSLDYDVYVNNENAEQYRLDLFVNIKPGDDYEGLEIDACIIGFFDFPKDTLHEEMEELIRINGSSILYSTLRGHISVVTSNFPSGSHLLPTLVMSEIVAEIEKEHAKKIQNENQKIIE